jgi:hypothetical protein
MYKYKLLIHNLLNGLVRKVETLAFGVLMDVIKYYADHQ